MQKKPAHRDFFSRFSSFLLFFTFLVFFPFQAKYLGVPLKKIDTWHHFFRIDKYLTN